MCGIAGFISHDLHSVDAEAQLRCMLAQIAHRGPDDEGQWLEGPVALGQRRLSIVDLSPLGHQPMASPSGRFELAFNGEIYNHRSLRRDLEQASIPFRGHSDTEVLLALIEQYGLVAALQQCIGMFAIALWDRRDRVLHLARDRFGEKPLYYGWCGKSMVFASELKSLTVHREFNSSINANAVQDVLHRGFVAPTECIYDGLRQVEPGTVASLSLDKMARNDRDFEAFVSTRFWSAVDAAQSGHDRQFAGSFTEAVDQLESCLRESVALQMQADVPLGAFLSGGVDSSVITALMQAQSGGKVRSYSIGFHGDDHNEAEHAKAVAHFLGTAHTEWYVDESEALALVPQLNDIYDEPLADASQIPTLILARLVRRDVTVALSGDGADEIFGGYPKYLRGDRMFHQPAREQIGRLIQGVAWGISPLQNMLPARVSARLPWHRLTTAAALYGAASQQELARELGALNRFGTSHMSPGLAARFTAAQKLTQPWSDSYKRSAMLSDAMSYLPGDILVKVDRATMNASLESRAPFLDHRVFEWAATLPDHFLFDGGVGKKVLRELLYRLVPRQLVERPKAGFNAPLGAWLRGHLKSWAYDTLASTAAKEMLDVDRCRQLLDLHCTTQFDLSARLWPMLVLASWAARWTAPGKLTSTTPATYTPSTPIQLA